MCKFFFGRKMNYILLNYPIKVSPMLLVELNIIRTNNAIRKMIG